MAKATFWGDLIRNLRTERKMSLRSLAKVAGVNRQTLQRIETGETTGEIDMVERCLMVFGYELDAIYASGIEEMLKLEEAEISTPEGRSKLARRRLLQL